MPAKGKTFVWAPDGQYICVRIPSHPWTEYFRLTRGCFQMYSSGLGAPQIYSRVSREEGAVKLELTTEAIQLGLLEVCVAAAILLQCGRNID